MVEDALARSSIPYSIVRPTWIFGGDRDVLVNNIAWILRHMPVFAIPGNGTYSVQPVHIADLVTICTEAARTGPNTVIDAAGPETMSFNELVLRIRAAIGARALILNVPAKVMALAARALGAVVRDVVLTSDEIDGLMAGLLVSHAPPLGRIAFSEWVEQSGASVGRRYANELRRHFVLDRV
jgi:NADH dehydrogenase